MMNSEKIVKSNISSMYKLSTKKLVIAALLSAISIILTRYVSIMIAGGSIRLGFGNLPIILSGILLGPSAGSLTGIVSDLFGVLIRPQGTFHPGFTLSSALTGFIPGLVVAVNSKNRFSLFNIIIANILVYLLISLGLNTLWLTTLLGKGFFILLPSRIVAGGIITVISITVIASLAKFFKYLNIE